MSTLNDIGALLRNYRKSQQLSLGALAERSKVHRNTLSALERGIGNVELNTLLAVCEQLGLDLVPTPKRISKLAQEHGVFIAAPTIDFNRKSALARSSTEDRNEPVPVASALHKRLAERLARANTKHIAQKLTPSLEQKKRDKK